MRFNLQKSKTKQNAHNCVYEEKVVVTNADELKEVTKCDHICGEFRDNRRSLSNFVKADVVVMDCDNDHSDDPVNWITVETLDEMLPDVNYAIVTSRNHMKEKGEKSAKPRFHVYFPIEEISDAKNYAALKRKIYIKYPFFDANALDAARMVFGSDTGQVVWHEGNKNIDEIVEKQEDKIMRSDETVKYEKQMNMQDLDGKQFNDDEKIVEGTRNSTLHIYALKVLTHYGECDEAYQLYKKEAGKCEPLLEEKEINSIWQSALQYYENMIATQPGYIPPDQYNGTAEERKSLKPLDYSEIGQSNVFAREYGNRIKYSDATGYLIYDGKCWKENKQLAIGLMKEFLNLQLAEAKKAVESAEIQLIQAGVSKKIVKSGKINEEILNEIQKQYYYGLIAAKKYLQFVQGERKFSDINSTLKLANPDILIEVTDLDKDAYLLNTPGGTYDLTRGIEGLQSHNPEDLITKMTECAPGDKGDQLWRESLDLFFCGDAELIEYVQFIVGMAAVGKVYQECLIIAYGDGANGKSTFWNAITKVLGTYSGMLSADALTVNCRRNVKPEMAELKGKRLVLASELEEGMRLNTGVLKQICSVGEIYADKKYKDPIKFKASHTLVLHTNHLPKVGSNDNGTWRRFIVIPFNAKIKEKSDIKNYTDHLIENADEAIMKWIIEGAKKAIDADFKTSLPACVEKATDTYKEENDWLSQFIEDCCYMDATLAEKSGELYQRYHEYCIETGEYYRGTRDFYAALDNRGYTRYKKHEGSYVRGLKLKPGTGFKVS